MQSFSFPSSERLKSRKVISKLFEEGKSFSKFPLRIIYLEIPENTDPIQIAVTVPKRSFKKAVDRNLLKRRIREAYRLNKHILTEESQNQSNPFAVMFIYTAKEILDSEKIHHSMTKVLKQLKPNLFT